MIYLKFCARKNNIIDSNRDLPMTNVYLMMGCSDHEGGNVSAHTGHLVSYFGFYLPECTYFSILPLAFKFYLVLSRQYSGYDH